MTPQEFEQAVNRARAGQHAPCTNEELAFIYQARLNGVHLTVEDVRRRKAAEAWKQKPKTVDFNDMKVVKEENA